MASGKRNGKEEGSKGVEAMLKSPRIPQKKKCVVLGSATARAKVRVSNIPLGMMTKETGELIGQEMGEFLEAEVDAEGMSVGEFLRIKVKLDVQEPLMRKIQIQVCLGDGEGEEEEEGSTVRRRAMKTRVARGWKA
ncbi:Retrotransposon protein [Hordeum vulgare]|nr:Retrotransposon protein [Hordeum vulgare]